MYSNFQDHLIAIHNNKQRMTGDLTEIDFFSLCRRSRSLFTAEHYNREGDE